MFFPPCYMLQLLDSIITTCFGPTKGNSTINVFPPCYMLQFLDIIVGLKKKIDIIVTTCFGPAKGNSTIKFLKS